MSVRDYAAVTILTLVCLMLADSDDEAAHVNESVAGERAVGAQAADRQPERRGSARLLAAREGFEQPAKQAALCPRATAGDVRPAGDALGFTNQGSQFAGPPMHRVAGAPGDVAGEKGEQVELGRNGVGGACAAPP